MSSTTERRPPQVTFAGWLVVAGGVIVLLGAFEAMSAIGSMETRELIEQFLSEPPGSELGIGYEGARQARQIAIMVLAACATAAAILGVFALKRDRVARIVLSILAVPLFIAGSVAGGFASAIVTVSIVMLWLEPARSWFAGRPVPERFRPPSERSKSTHEEERTSTGESGGHTTDNAAPPITQSPWGPPQQPSTQQPGAQQPPAYPTAYPTAQQPAGDPGFGDPSSAHPHPGAHPGAYGTRPGESAGVRPGALRWACVLTWVFTGLVALLMVAQAAIIVAMPDTIIAEVRATYPEWSEEDLPTSYLVGSAVVMSLIIVLWCAVASVMAVLAWRGRNWARIVLLVSASITAVFALIASLIAFYMLVVAAAAVATVVALCRPEVARWSTGRPAAR